MEQKKRSKLQERRLWLFVLPILIICVTWTSIETKNLQNFRFTTSDNVASINYSSNNIVKSQSQGQRSNGNSNNNDIQQLMKLNTAHKQNSNIPNHNYVWVGNHWIPPLNIPQYTPCQMNEIFRNLNTLWIGDSNNRQDIMTMYSMINATNTSNINRLDLNLNINLGKNGGYECKDTATRDFSPNTTILGKYSSPTSFLCHQVLDSGSSLIDSSSSNTATNVNKKNKKLGKGKFDALGAACPATIINIVNDETNNNITLLSSLLNNYDILVIDLGIWEIVRNRDCRPKTHNESTLTRINNTLNTLLSVASPNLTIFWKTTGSSSEFSNDSGHMQNLNNMNDLVREWFHSLRERQYIHLIDWEKQIHPRSFGSDRIVGDLKPHWGLEARTLTAQMITHGVVVATMLQNQ